jgi:dTDP-glucose pyrophosphorylase
MNILILSAGSNEAFKNAGYVYPKNLIEIKGVPLLQHAVEKLVSAGLTITDNKFIFLIRKEESRHFHTAAVLQLISPSAKVIEVPQPTAGAACTALLAIDHINNDEPLVIVNGDIILQTNLRQAVQQFMDQQLDGGILVFESIHPRWSYVKCDSAGLVIEAAEKRPISNMATVGFYFFRRGKDFVNAATTMISKDAQVGGQFYICPSYNEMILAHAKIGVIKIPRSAYISLASPRDVQDYVTDKRHEAEHASS